MPAFILEIRPTVLCSFVEVLLLGYSIGWERFRSVKQNVHRPLFSHSSKTKGSIWDCFNAEQYSIVRCVSRDEIFSSSEMTVMLSAQDFLTVRHPLSTVCLICASFGEKGVSFYPKFPQKGQSRTSVGTLERRNCQNPKFPPALSFFAAAALPLPNRNCSLACAIKVYIGF